MATTDAELAWAALDIFDRVGVDYVLLHGLDRLRQGQVSDVDIAVKARPADVVEATRSAFSGVGLKPIVVWPYDVGDTRTVFYADSTAVHGLQLDMLCDPRGLGRYSIRSDRLFEFRAASPRPPHLDEAAELIYLWSKRSAKGQYERMARLSDRARTVDPDRMRDASERLTGSTRTSEALLRGEPLTRRRVRVTAGQARRLTGRVYHPIGFWAHASDRGVAEELRFRFSRLLINAEIVDGSTRSRPRSLARAVSLKLRPALAITIGERPSKLADLMVDGPSSDHAAATLTAAMSLRVFR